MREYLGWSRRAHEGTNAQTPSVSSQPYQLRVVPPAAMGQARAQADSAARRRRVLMVMAGAVAAPALVALATGSNAAWWGLLALVPVVLAYLGVLFRTRRHMAEREFNVAFFGRGRRGAAGLEEVFSGHQDPQWDSDQWDGVGAARASRRARALRPPPALFCPRALLTRQPTRQRMPAQWSKRARATTGHCRPWSSAFPA